jgi:hypothetical protein
MAPVTRASLRGRSISREGSWQIPTEEDFAPEQDSNPLEAMDESVGDETTGDEQSVDGIDADPIHKHQGMPLQLVISEKDLSDFTQVWPHQ